LHRAIVDYNPCVGRAAGRDAVHGKRVVVAGSVDAVLFDFDGTLTAPGAIDFAAIREAVGCPPDRLILEYITALEDPVERRRRFDLLEEFEIVAAVASRPNAGAEEVVQALHARGLGLGILSRNGLASIERAFQNFAHIDRTWFQVIVSRDSAVPPKPAPDGVLLAAREMDVDAARMLMVGDYVLDVQAGRAAGAITVFLEDHWRLEEFDVTADFVIRDLRELEAIVDARSGPWRRRAPAAPGTDVPAPSS
jgi:HAD superfamily hydrolase (TIGR01509 family)